MAEVNIMDVKGQHHRAACIAELLPVEEAVAQTYRHNSIPVHHHLPAALQPALRTNSHYIVKATQVFPSLITIHQTKEQG